MPTKPFSASLVLLSALCLTAHAQPAQEKSGQLADKASDGKQVKDAGRDKNKGFQGGGIRGAMPVDADRWLVLPDEAQSFGGQAGFDESPMLRPRGINPSIELVQPDVQADSKLKSPFPIQVNFRGMSDAAIDPASFRVFYGALKIDITARLTGHVKVTPEGFVLDQAKIPKGRHRLTLQIQDNKQRVAERELRIDVE